MLFYDCVIFFNRLEIFADDICHGLIKSTIYLFINYCFPIVLHLTFKFLIKYGNNVGEISAYYFAKNKIIITALSVNNNVILLTMFFCNEFLIKHIETSVFQLE